MTVTIQKLKKKDYKNLMFFALEGMNFRQYSSSNLLLTLYSRYFVYLELQRASHIYAAYEGEQLLGALMLNLKDVPKPFQTKWQTCYVAVFDVLQKLLDGNRVSTYNKANKTMLDNYLKQHDVNDEIVFLAVNPTIKSKGVGSLLLQHAQKEHAGKHIYLYTDSGCSYQFYDKRDFQRVGQQSIPLNQLNFLTCMLYAKTF